MDGRGGGEQEVAARRSNRRLLPRTWATRRRDKRRSPSKSAQVDGELPPTHDRTNRQS